MSNETRYLPSWMTESCCTVEEQKSEEFIKFEGRIELCIFANMIAACAEEILEMVESSKTSEVVYGFDMEWPVSYIGKTNKTALIQICPKPSVCYLFHVFYMPKLPSIFVHLINHPRVRWSGVFISNDFKKLGKDFNIDVSGALSRIIDLGTYTNTILNFDSCYRWSMTNLVQQLLKKNVDKNTTVRMGHWENISLDQNQCMYAATDAYWQFGYNGVVTP